MLALLFEKSFRYSAEKEFKLASGRMSDFYIDCKATTLRADGLALTGEVIFDLVRDQGIKAVGGLTLGADPIAASTALVSFQQGEPIDAFVVRKEAKGHGTRRWIEGSVTPETPIAVIEDVITTGGSAINAIERCLEGGLVVKGVIALVDRQEGGREALEKLLRERCGEDAWLKSVFTRSDFLDMMQQRGDSGPGS